jgi:hypothetical protein
VSEAEQLAALARLHERFDREGIDYWLFGGWAVDFHAGRVTRAHDDLDVAVWMRERDRIASLLSADGWQQTSGAAAEGCISYRVAPFDWRSPSSNEAMTDGCTRRSKKGEPTGRTRPSAMTWPTCEACARGSSASPRSGRTSQNFVRTRKVAAKDRQTRKSSHACGSRCGGRCGSPGSCGVRLFGSRS